MNIEKIQFGTYNLGVVKVCAHGHMYVTCTSLRNHWMRARRLDRIAFEKALDIYKLPVYGINCISIDDLKMVLAMLITRYDTTARSMMESYLEKCLME